MHTEIVNLDPALAAILVRKYKEHRAWQTPVDAEILRVAKMVEAGKKVVNALASISTAGVGPDGRPLLAIARADQKTCYLDLRTDGSAIMHNCPSRWLPQRMASSIRFDFPARTFAERRDGGERCESIVPHIPPDIRPKRGIQNYHILYEATWNRSVPIDPLLLRRIGKDGDMWLCVAMWELTSIERAVLTGNLGKKPL